MNTAHIALRSIGAADLPFLFEVYASTRLAELAPFGWSADQQATFLAQQFEAQHHHYQAHYLNAEFLVILLDNQSIGRLYINRASDELRIVDIALLPDYRNNGIGSYLLQALLAEATQAGKPVRLHVEKFNSAMRLYERLGFQVIEDRGVYWFMERTPQAPMRKMQPAYAQRPYVADLT